MPKRNIHIRLGTNVDDGYTELVERKGLGHPDTLIDGIMEEVSRELCKEYLGTFGTILHHNVDKGLIVGGEAKVEFGGGTIEKPAEIYLAGRATYEHAGKIVNVEGIAMEAARSYLTANCRHLDVDKDVVIIPRIRKGSTDLVGLFGSGTKIPLSNDTSFGTGFAPYSRLESVVLEVERHLNSPSYKEKCPWIGEDIKVMGLREGDVLKITAAAAFVSCHIADIRDYIEKKEQLHDYLRSFISKMYSGEFEVNVNTADDYKNGFVYLTKTGLSMEMGDDGEVGRGNRATGLITPYRKMSLEATAGKNPVNHVGKIYNVLANEVTRTIIAEHDYVKSATFTILSEIGRPIDEPCSADVELVLSQGVRLDDVKEKVRYTVDAIMEDLPEITSKIIYGKAGIY